MGAVRLSIKMAEGCKIVEDQTGQENWYRIDTSSPEYGEWKKIVGYKKYWGEKNVKLKDKEPWARMRCGNIGRAGNKGYMNVNCRLCGAVKENLKHILDCREFKKVVKMDLRLAVEKVMRGEGNDPMFWTTILSGRIKSELGEYCRMFEREAKAREQAELWEVVIGQI